MDDSVWRAQCLIFRLLGWTHPERAPRGHPSHTHTRPSRPTVQPFQTAQSRFTCVVWVISRWTSPNLEAPTLGSQMLHLAHIPVCHIAPRMPSKSDLMGREMDPPGHGYKNQFPPQLRHTRYLPIVLWGHQLNWHCRWNTVSMLRILTCTLTFCAGLVFNNRLSEGEVCP